MSNVREGDFCTHKVIGGLLHVEKAIEVRLGDVWWQLRAISPIRYRHHYDLDTGIVTKREGIASPGSGMGCWDSQLRRVDPPAEDTNLAAQDIISAAMKVLTAPPLAKKVSLD